MSIAKALLAFQADAPPVHLDATNPHFKNRYASLGGVVAAVRPALNKHGLVYTQLPTNLDGTPALRTVLMHADSGEVLEDTMPLILSKQDSQAQGSALTYGRRYALLSILGLVGDEDDDANNASSSGAGGTALGGASSSDSSASNSSKDAHGLQSSRADAVLAGDALDDSGATLLSFGKHKNTAIKDVPRAYLEWWCGQETPKTDDLKRQRAAVELFLGLAPVGASPDDDIPF